MKLEVKNLISTAIQVVGALFAAFGSFLQRILPEQINGKEFLYTYMQIICVIVFLLVKFSVLRNVSVNVWKRIIFGSVAVVVLSGFAYYYHSSHTLKRIGNSEYKAIAGVLTEEATKICNNEYYRNDRKLKHMSCEERLLSTFTNEELNIIWTNESVKKNMNIFTILYSVFTLSLAVSIFSLVELIPVNSKKAVKG